MDERLRVLIIGSGNIGTDLMAKVGRSPTLELVGVAGIDPDSPGLAKAAAAGITTSHDGLDELLGRAPDVDLAFDATSASAHAVHAELLKERGIISIDLTPAALGPGRRVRGRAPTSTSSPSPPHARSNRSAAPDAARRSSS